ncbi:SPOR domain-containing protein [Ferrimonas sediminicola]|uniref:SPOR domain-containing protein n=1 Tax=Ferrimonas sediminicola TaxID=2569538 RepID=A0A4U1BFY1_9GAMM|nr:SPOR domain-containing protein [Ferrimonas sediminicola]TKB49853.1 SPOR domain-containing protein [Ferrimonas sediminicola]
MSDQLKNRIVGILVLTALAVIFLPNLLDGEKRRMEENFATIPLGPVALPQEVPEQAFEPVVLESASGPSEQPGAEPAAGALASGQSTKAAESGSQPQEKGVNGGWTLQVGSFKNAKNVTKLVNDLREQGFRAYSVPARPIEGRINRVFVGPDVSKNRLEKERVRLVKATNLKGALVPYKATDI